MPLGVLLMFFLALSGCSQNTRNEGTGETRVQPTKGRIGETEDQLSKRYGNVLERTTDGGYQVIEFQIEGYNLRFTMIEGVAEGVTVTKHQKPLNPDEVRVLIEKITGTPLNTWKFKSTPKFIMIDTPEGYGGLFSIQNGILIISSKKLEDLQSAQKYERDTRGLKGF